MARDLRLGLVIEQMATKMNMMKMVQEMQGMAVITNRRPQSRSFGPLMLPIRCSGGADSKRKRHIRIIMREPVDIPRPVKIKHL